jgi:hypothetical protein
VARRACGGICSRDPPPTLLLQTTVVPFERVWTTSANANALLGASGFTRVPTVQSYTVDFNLDGVPDELVITLEVRARHL